MICTSKLKPQNRLQAFLGDDKVVLTSMILITTSSIYYLFNFPLLVVLGTSISGMILAIAFLTTQAFAISISVFKLKLSWQVKPWLFWSTIVAFLIVMGSAIPAQALLFDTAETAVTDIITAAGSNIDTAVITGIFTFFRLIVILAFIAGIIGMAYQAMQGGDWKPIFTAMGIAMGIVMAVEVLTNMILA